MCKYKAYMAVVKEYCELEFTDSDLTTCVSETAEY